MELNVITIPFHLAKNGSVHACRSASPERTQPLGKWTAIREKTSSATPEGAWLVTAILEHTGLPAVQWTTRLPWPPKGATFMQPAPEQTIPGQSPSSADSKETKNAERQL